MEQAHTQLISQLNERILAADNTPLYIKFAETVKNAVRSGVLEHGNILPGERDLSQLTGVSRITVRKAMQALDRGAALGALMRLEHPNASAEAALTMLAQLSPAQSGEGAYQGAEFSHRGTIAIHFTV